MIPKHLEPTILPIATANFEAYILTKPPVVDAKGAPSRS